MEPCRICRIRGRLLIGVLLACMAWISVALATPWEGYGRTYPVPRYELDPNANFDYRFDPEKSFPPYTDPDFEIGRDLPSPLDDPDLESFDVIVVVNKRNHPFWGMAETLRAYRRGEGLVYYWLISTGNRGWETPSGYFTVRGYSSRHWSGPFDAPMFWSVFFDRGKALHSSLDRQALGDLGAPASHGCVHIEEYRAEALFHLIGQSGYGDIPRLNPKSGRPIVGADGQLVLTPAPKTLIIIAPTGPFGVHAPIP